MRIATRLCAAAAAGAGVLGGPGAAGAADGCTHALVTGATQYDPGVNAYVGSAVFTIDGVERSAAAVTYPLAVPVELPSGMLLVPTMHVFDFGGGSTLTTDDWVVLFPTDEPGIYDLHSSIVITGGTGEFAGATGHLRGLEGSVADLFAGQTFPVVGGVICTP